MNVQTALALGLSPRLTHKANLRQTRYGWLRLTPAYSVHLVSEILDCRSKKTLKEDTVVLDPFCGTGTTALVCAERGIKADTTDINPFLLWLTRTKTHNYSREDIVQFEHKSHKVAAAILASDPPASWMPPLHQIEKWWDSRTLAVLSRAMSAITTLSKDNDCPANNLLKIAFCRVMIDQSNASFGHQSMSFKKKVSDALPSLVQAQDNLNEDWLAAVHSISQAACSPICSEPRLILCDARSLTEQCPDERYSCVITSPPYPNRMSYIRELRPYMYWLGYLETGRDAGELDWKAIGGTWGCATSNVGKWRPEGNRQIPHEGFHFILEQIAETSPLLARYVHKYFHDMIVHVMDLFKVMKAGGDLHYIVGNSKFYEVMLPVQEIFASLFRDAGFEDVRITTTRKRTSKKELFEYHVSASKPLNHRAISAKP